MLTLKSKFSDYFKLVMSIACSDAVEQYEGIVHKDDTRTIAQVFKDFNDDPNLNEGWCEWAICAVGKELGADVRTMIINRMKDPIMCLKLVYRCPFLSEAEVLLLKSKYEGQGEDIAKAVICCDAIVKSREFNAVRVAAVTTCKSVTEAKALIELKTDIVTTVSADTAVKSSDELKKILESERTKVTLATNEVMRSQGFVDGNGNGSVSVFESWLEGA